MPWIARDATNSNPYRIFGTRPRKLQMVSYEGERIPGQFTWTCDARGAKTYGPLCNNEPTVLPPEDSPVELEPGEGPIEVKVVLVGEVRRRPWEGEGI